MRLLVDILIAIVIAATLGIGSAWYAVGEGNLFGAVRVGAWTAWPRTGSADADPYSLAWLARTGEVPLGAGEGIAFIADTDSSGAPLTGACSYLVAGQTPTARLWTLTAYDSNGGLMTNAAGRTGFHSRDIVRRADGSFAIVVSTEASPGNWLPIASVDRFALALRLYDTPLTAGSTIAGQPMPEIVREHCG